MGAWDRIRKYKDLVMGSMSGDAKKDIDRDALRKARKALFIAQSGIGNLLLATPSMRVLAAKVPGIRIDVLLANRGGEAVIKGSSWMSGGRAIVVKEFQEMEKKDMDALEKELKGEGYDIVVVTYPSNNVESAIIALSTGAPARAGHSSKALMNPDKLYNAVAHHVPGRHEVDLNVDLVRALGIEVDEGGVPEPEIELSDEERASALELLSMCDMEKDLLIGFHPGAHKDMPEKRWGGFGELARHILEKRKDARVLVFGGPEEGGLGAEIVEGAGEIGEGCRVMDLVGKMGVRETAALISHCRAFVSNDSGLMHIAAAVRVPLVAVFGPTDYERTGPRGRHLTARKAMNCMPCYVLPGDVIKCDHRRCLTGMTAEEVLATLDELLIS